MRPMLVKIARNDIIQKKLKWSYFPVRIVHAELPQLGERQLAVVEGIQQNEQQGSKQKTWNVGII